MDTQLFRIAFQSLSRQERFDYLASLTKDELLYLYENPDNFLHNKQIIPDGDWIYFLLRCGRSFGKTTAGAAWIAKKIRQGAKIVGLCGPTYDDVAKVMVPAILSLFLPGEVTDTAYNHQTHTIRFTNGAKIYCYTSDKSTRGPNLEYLWCDEICVWAQGQPDKIKERFEDISRAVRVGNHPQIIITSTPMAHPFFFDFQQEVDNNNPNYKIITGTMFENPFLPKSYIDEQLKKYGNTNRGKQELYGELIYENPDALFQRTWIDDNRITSPDNPCHINDIDIAYFFSLVVKGDIILKRGVIPVDPSGSSKSTSDETGIMVLLQDYKNDVYLLHDASGTLSPDQWAQSIRSLFNHYKRILPMVIVAETNFGGDLVISNICSVDKSLKPFIKEIKASKSKMIRAEVSAAKYERGKIHHVGHFEKLERQMVNYVGTDSSKLYHDDRMDALVHGINELVVVPQYATRDIRHLLENIG